MITQQTRNPTNDGQVLRFLVHAMGHMALDWNASVYDLDAKAIEDAQMILRRSIKQITFWTARKSYWENL